ncbi:MAG: hypothetical protein HWE26_13800 [Alteromonadaceae bacterium]|nr:hypothetical protein [Alteromonadaceae bacterium]
MDFLTSAALASEAAAICGAAGWQVERVSDLATVPDLVADLGKNYLTPLSDPRRSDLWSDNAAALLARDASTGAPVAFGLARREVMGAAGPSAYWPRLLARAYVDGARSVVDRVSPEAAAVFDGARTVAYFGDVFVADRARGKASALRAFSAIAHLTIGAEWSPDLVYCFMDGRKVRRGLALSVGFLSVLPSPMVWAADPPSPRSSAEWLAYTRAADRAAMVRALLVADGVGV